VSTFNVPYNTKSIMHYGSYAFSKNEQPTILTKVKPYQISKMYWFNIVANNLHLQNFLQSGGVIADPERLRSTDILKLKRMYKC